MEDNRLVYSLQGRYEFVDRYSALGIPYPEPATVCHGQCEGIGVVPIQGGPSRSGLRVEGNPEEPWRSLWLEAEKKSPSDDGWHFVTCPDCNGTGKRAAPPPPINQTAITGSLSLAFQRVEAETGLFQGFVVRWVREKFVVKMAELMLKYFKQSGYLS